MTRIAQIHSNRKPRHGLGRSDTKPVPLPSIGADQAGGEGSVGLWAGCRHSDPTGCSQPAAMIAYATLLPVLM